MEKKKTYVLMLSQVFPKTHNKAGMPTEFKEKVLNKKKIHTIRANYHLWERRIKEVQEGRAVLAVRQWTGKPYCSKQVEIARLTTEDGVGIQLLELRRNGQMIFQSALSETTDIAMFLLLKMMDCTLLTGLIGLVATTSQSPWR